MNACLRQYADPTGLSSLLPPHVCSNALNTFILPFMEASLVTFRRLEVLCREMVGLTTRDPQLLAFARVQTHLLPCYMPLAYSSEWRLL